MTTNYIIRKSYFDVECGLILDERYTLKNGTHHLCVQLYQNKKYYHYRTGLKIKSWADASQREQNTVYKIYDKAYDLVCDLVDQQIFSFDEFKNRIEAPVIHTLNDAMRARIEKYKKNNQFSTAAHYASALKLYEKVIGVTPFASVSATQLNKLKEYMQKEEYSDTSICIYFADLKSIINEARFNGLLKDKNYPFKKHQYDTSKVEIPKPEKRTMSFLTKPEMMQVFDYYKKTKNEYVGLFLFSYLAGGMNLADVIRLKWSQHYFDTDGQELIYKRIKTEKKNDFFIRVAISDEMKKLMDFDRAKLNGYVFHYLDGLKDVKDIRTKVATVSHKVQYHLKRMVIKLGMEKDVTPTFARHSFSTILRREFVPSEFVEYQMGHSLKGVAGNYFGGYSTAELLKFSSYLTA